MALSAPTSLGTFATNNAGEAAHGTGAFSNSITTVNNSLLVVAVTILDFEGADFSANITLSGGSLTYTRRVEFTFDDPSLIFCYIAIYTAPVTTGATFDLSVDCGADDIYGYKVNPVYYTGHDTTTPTGATATGEESPGSGAVAITLSGAPASTSSVLAAIHVICGAANAVTPGTGWTEIADFHGTGDNFHQLQTQHRTGSTSTTVGWDNVGTPGFDVGGVALEIVAAAEGGAAVRATGRGLTHSVLLGGRRLVAAPALAGWAARRGLILPERLAA